MKRERRPKPIGWTLPVVAIGIAVAAFAGTPLVAYAQDAMTFGNVEVSIGDSFASGNSDLAWLAGVGPHTQILSGGTKLHLNERLSYKRGELFVNDTLALYQGVDGAVLSNELVQGYLSITPVPQLTVVIGKRRLSWGYGYAFSPGDRIDPPQNPENRSQGFYGLTATLSPSASLTMTAAVRFDTAFPALSSLAGFTAAGSSATAAAATSLPFLATYVPSASGNPWSRLRYAVYADKLFGNLDTYLATTYQWDRTLRPAVGFSIDLGGTIANGAVAVELQNSDLYPATASAGGAYRTPVFGKPYPLATVGLQRTVGTDNGTYSITAEYLYDGTGYDRSQANTFYSDLLPALAAIPHGTYTAADYVVGDASAGAWLAGGEVIPGLGRNYAALSASASVTKLFSVSLAGLVNLQDGSFALQPEVRFTRLAGIDIFARGIIGWGRNDHTEFGLLPAPVTITSGAIVHF